MLLKKCRIYCLDPGKWSGSSRHCIGFTGQDRILVKKGFPLLCWFGLPRLNPKDMGASVGHCQFYTVTRKLLKFFIPQKTSATNPKFGSTSHGFKPKYTVKWGTQMTIIFPRWQIWGSKVSFWCSEQTNHEIILILFSLTHFFANANRTLVCEITLQSCLKKPTCYTFIVTLSMTLVYTIQKCPL